MVTQAVADGAAALRAFEQRTPGLVVLDVGMPEMDGLEVCRLIRRTSDVPILFLSARDEEIDRILGLEMGGDDYVTKPFSPRELVARVNVILRRARPQPARRCTCAAAACAWPPVAGAGEPHGTLRRQRHQPHGDRIRDRQKPARQAGACAQPHPAGRSQPCRPHPYFATHDRQPHPQHPRQACRGWRDRCDRDRAWRRLQARPMWRVRR